MDKLIREARELINQGIYHQDVLFALMFPKSGKHYSVVREAIHRAKVG